MKAIITTAAAILLTGSVFAQSNFIRAFAVHKGLYDGDDLEFDEGKACNTLIEMDGVTITVHTNPPNTFHLTSAEYESENLNTWNAVDEKGNKCVFYFGITKDSTLYVMFEYGLKTILYYGDAENN
jgi:hypothetical protein